MIPDFSDKEAFPGVLGWRKQGAWRLVRNVGSFRNRRGDTLLWAFGNS